MSIPRVLRSLKVRRDLECVTPSATHPMPRSGLASLGLKKHQEMSLSF